MLGDFFRDVERLVPILLQHVPNVREFLDGDDCEEFKRLREGRRAKDTHRQQENNSMLEVGGLLNTQRLQRVWDTRVASLTMMVAARTSVGSGQ